MRLYNIEASAIMTYWHQLYTKGFSDKRIASYLADLFESELQGVQVEGLRFYVKGRIVSIYGTLYREVDHEQIIKLTSRIVGLHAIVDRIQVVKDVTKEELGARIHLLLSDNYEPRHLLPA